ncbi:hypothetical protein [Chryseobacterium taiwanense]|uniref:Bacteriocin n=1 Tax=Chryseobacterium taiwanense TaxID=363331 RepID=A0A0B4EDS3_9FLAO|nr:hypothetical protein [Chryseobacterium taiwanense]KIC64738.1 hypothetical protein RM51_02140 [Chryseobacterium taiwanense]
MKNSNLKKGQKLSREAQKSVLGGDFEIQCASGCYNFYLSDGQGNCLVPPCASPNFGTEVKGANGRYQCCY